MDDKLEELKISLVLGFSYATALSELEILRTIKSTLPDLLEYFDKILSFTSLDVNGLLKLNNYPKFLEENASLITLSWNGINTYSMQDIHTINLKNIKVNMTAEDIKNLSLDISKKIMFNLYLESEKYIPEGVLISGTSDIINKLIILYSNAILKVVYLNVEKYADRLKRANYTLSLFNDNVNFDFIPKKEDKKKKPK